jgi:hypothetical protein
VSETIIDYARTIYDALNRAMGSHPYAAIRMHPETAREVKRVATLHDYSTLTTLPTLMGMTLIADDSVEPGQFRFEYEAPVTVRAV